MQTGRIAAEIRSVGLRMAFAMLLLAPAAFAQCTSYGSTYGCTTSLSGSTASPNVYEGASNTIYATYYSRDGSGNICNMASASVTVSIDGGGAQTMSWDSVNERYYYTFSTSGYSTGTHTYSISASQDAYSSASFTGGTFSVTQDPISVVSIQGQIAYTATKTPLPQGSMQVAIKRDGVTKWGPTNLNNVIQMGIVTRAFGADNTLRLLPGYVHTMDIKICDGATYGAGTCDPTTFTLSFTP